MRDVRVGPNDTAVSQRDGADFQDSAVGASSLVRERLAFQSPCGNECAVVIRDMFELTDRDLMPSDRVEGSAIEKQVFGEIQEVSRTSIVDPHPLIGPEHQEALIHAFQRRPEQFAPLARLPLGTVQVRDIQ